MGKNAEFSTFFRTTKMLTVSEFISPHPHTPEMFSLPFPHISDATHRVMLFGVSLKDRSDHMLKILAHDGEWGSTIP